MEGTLAVVGRLLLILPGVSKQNPSNTALSSVKVEAAKKKEKAKAVNQVAVYYSFEGKLLESL